MEEKGEGGGGGGDEMKSGAEDGEGVGGRGKGWDKGGWRRGEVEVKCFGHESRWIVWQADS